VTEDLETSNWQPTADGASSPAGGTSVQQRAAQLADERPEVAAGAAFAGGLVLALILKRLAR
jgi:hypothetical protein